MTTKASTKRKRSRTNATAKVEVNGKTTAALKIQNLPIGKIKPDPEQPRKSFDEKQLQQLSDSIKEFGVLQPITVRKSGSGFVIVMGERRYRASKLAGKKTIPSIVRTFEDDEVLEVQIIENLQRKDVEPTEEAEAIAYLSDKYSPSEIAKRLGRTDNFIRQRLKLAGLIDGFKHFVRNGEMTISLGVAVALFEAEEQQMMLETMGEDFNANQINRMIQDHTFDLENAPFDTADEKLVTKAGACGDCPFNAANQGNLFGEGKMVCTKSVCFEAKKSKTFLNVIERCKKENMLLIPQIRQYWLDDENNLAAISLLESKGFKVYLLDDIEIIEEPTKPTMDSVKHENRFYDCSEDELKAELQEKITTYKEELDRYKSAEANGYEKGILFHPKSFQTQDAFIKVIDKSETAQSTNSVSFDKKKMADCSPEEQIIKINEREIRKKQIENNNQFKEVVEMICETKYIDTKKTLSTDEMVAFSISLFENNVDYMSQQKYFSKLLGDTSMMTKVEMVENFKKKFKKEIFHRLIRCMLTKQVHFGESNHVNNLTNISFYNAMQGHYKSKIASIEKKYTEKRNKREARLKERIDVLEKKIQELSE
ncbi:MAG: partitioning protein [Muricauda sp.]|nr:ParB/RepB/Spo0J family partition protein [Allomuricauda sp.]MBC31812.1 partitioning protein [Allomuricauda sp.]|tara:strand:+ start:323 stop:2110 length:1788 start_codon:yes stop_codon:yes gene_type:complete